MVFTAARSVIRLFTRTLVPFLWFSILRGVSMQVSLKTLGLRKDIVTCWAIGEAPDALRDLNLNGEGSLVWVVPDRISGHVKINSLFSEKIRGATVYVS